MILNKCKIGMCATYWLDEVIPDTIEKNIYHVQLSTGNVKSFADEVSKFIYSNANTKIDGIILDATGEAPEKERYAELFDLLDMAGYDRNKILCIDSGLTFLWQTNHIILPWWMDHFAHSDTALIHPVAERTTLFLVLSRIAKYHRVKLISALVEHGLDAFSIMSCGSNALTERNITVDNKLFDELVPTSIRNKFPIIYGDRVDRATGSDMIDDDFKKCLINVIIESGFENELFGASGPSSLSWNRLFYTEKTDKCFYLGQIPICLAKKGYVSTLRDVYGFDMFDEIVDHSYDTIDDPIQRIDAVAQECIRLSTIGISTLQSMPGITERMIYNKNQIRIVKNRILSDSAGVLNNWLKEL